MQFTELLDNLKPDGDGLRVEVPESWHQGRTLFGGVNAALCLAAVRKLTGETRALRSLMISFVGPASGDLTISATTLRAGRNMCSVHASATSNGEQATDALFAFADLRDSNVNFDPPPAPDAPPPPEASQAKYDRLPAFARYFDYGRGHGEFPFSSGQVPDMSIWTRFVDPAAREGEESLLAIADVTAPAMSIMMPRPAPLATVNWQLNILPQKPETEDGWWLLSSRTEQAAGGFARHAMGIWNTRGECVAVMSQLMTVFA